MFFFSFDPVPHTFSTPAARLSATRLSDATSCKRKQFSNKAKAARVVLNKTTNIAFLFVYFMATLTT